MTLLKPSRTVVSTSLSSDTSPLLKVSGASAPSRLALDGSGCLGGPAPGQQFAEASVGPVVDEPGQHIGQVSMRIDAVQFAGLDQRGEHGPVFRSFIRT